MSHKGSNIFTKQKTLLTYVSIGLSIFITTCLMGVPSFRKAEKDEITLNINDKIRPVRPKSIFTGVKGINFQTRRWLVTSLPDEDEDRGILLIKKKGKIIFDVKGKVLKSLVINSLEDGKLIISNSKGALFSKDIKAGEKMKLDTGIELVPVNNTGKAKTSEIMIDYSEPASMFVTELTYSKKPKPPLRTRTATPTPANTSNTPRATATVIRSPIPTQSPPVSTNTPRPTATNTQISPTSVPTSTFTNTPYYTQTPTLTPTYVQGTPSPTPTQPGGIAGGVELPRSYVNSSYPVLAGGHLIRTVKSNCNGLTNCYTNFQTALDAVLPGEEIVIDAGIILTAPSGGFILKSKTNPNNSWIIIRSANINALPAGNNRVSPAQAPQMPKIVSADNLAAISTATGAHHYYFSGIEISISSNSSLGDALASNALSNSGLIMLGSVYETNLANQAHHITFDRCYIHGSATKNTRRGIFLNSGETAIVNSYLSQFNDIGADAQAILGANGSGPHKIFNNYLEASGENILYGGIDASITNVEPADIEIRNNHITKPLSWRQGSAGYAGYPWVIKNLLEIKYGQRILIDGNVIENNWAAAQSGMALNIKTVNQDNTMPWAITQNVTITNNIVRHAALGVTLVDRDNNGPSGITNNVRIANNLFDDISASRWGNGYGGTFALVLGPPNMKLDHNTVLNDGTTIVADSAPANNFVFTNNIVFLTGYGIKGSGSGSGSSTIGTWFPNSSFSRNVFVGDGTGYPSNNYYPSTANNVGFLNYNGGNGGNYALSSSSSYLNVGTDGQNAGADMTVVNNSTSCAISGLC